MLTYYLLLKQHKYFIWNYNNVLKVFLWFKFKKNVYKLKDTVNNYYVLTVNIGA